MRRWAFPLLVAGMILLVSFLSGCEQEKSTPRPSRPAPKKAAVPKADKKQQNETAKVEEKAPPEYVYDATGRRDPFENPLQEFQAPVVAEEPLTPLQKFDLGQLRLIGVILGKGEPTAMVIAPDCKSFILKKGVKVGKNNGVVVKIDPAGVQIEEKYYDFTGEVRTNTKELRLSQRGGA